MNPRGIFIGPHASGSLDPELHPLFDLVVLKVSAVSSYAPRLITAGALREAATGVRVHPSSTSKPRLGVTSITGGYHAFKYTLQGSLCLSQHLWWGCAGRDLEVPSTEVRVNARTANVRMFDSVAPGIQCSLWCWRWCPGRTGGGWTIFSTRRERERTAVRQDVEQDEG